MDIMKMITGTMTPMIAGKVAGAFGVPEGIVRKMMAVGVPVILASIMKRGATAGGTDAIGAALAGMGKNPLDGLGAALGGDASKINSAAQGGADMLSSLLGVGAAGGLAKTLASYAGVDEKAAGPLLGLAGSAALGGLKTAADTQGLDAAGVMRLLGTQKNQIEGAIPADLGRMLSASGLLPQAADVTNAARATIPAASAPAQSGGIMKWIIGALVLAALAWFAFTRFGAKPEEVVTEAPATATAAADALVVDGVNIGESIQGILTNITGTLAGVKDADTATAAVQSLTDADTALGGLGTAVGALTGDGKTALQALIGGALPALKTTIDGLLADTAIGPILKPALDGILAKLTSFGG
ncbi:MAG: DUF937 domain-containing protein [Rhodobacterales bacterium]|nr:DUF937 domain-containing protein [Rhodobacterales bacterium]